MILIFYGMDIYADWSKIRQLRIANQMTQEELADRAELSKGFISQIENDLTSPSINTLVDILQCLGTDLKTFSVILKTNKLFSERKTIFKTDNELKTP